MTAGASSKNQGQEVHKMRRLPGFATVVIACGVALGFCTSQSAVAASVYDVTIDTASLSGTASTLAFDFIAGGSAASNSIVISDFSTNGTLTSTGPNSGSSVGTLPGQITLSQTGGSPFFNENLQGITLGSTLSFQFTATTNPGGIPDEFSFFILNSSASLPILNTTDPTGSDALFVDEIDGSPNGLVSVYSTQEGVTAMVTPVPLPGTMILLFSGMMGASLIGLARRERISSELKREPASLT